MADGVPVVEAAPAKLNLDLHVERRRPDGYHDLDSAVAFTDFGDTLILTPARAFALHLEGAFGAALALEGESLIRRAGEALATALGRPLAVRVDLVKRIPLAAGLGGGSADAAAMLRGLVRLWQAELPAADLQAIARGLGADVPVCLAGRPATMRGIGDVLAPAPPLPPLHLVLVNAGLPVPTGLVYAALEAADFGPAPARTGDWIAAGRNALEAAALRVEPGIGAVFERLRALGAPVVRLCGSGGTVFAAFPEPAAADRVATVLRAERPAWLVERTRLLP